jgi:hypothetical protein
MKEKPNERADMFTDLQGKLSAEGSVHSREPFCSLVVRNKIVPQDPKCKKCHHKAAQCNRV